MQFRRATAAGRPFHAFFARRMTVLLVLGLAHGLLLWMGDILLTYALFGFAGLLFLKRRPKTIVIFGALFWLLPLVGHFVLMMAWWGAATDQWGNQWEWRQYGEWLVDAYLAGTVSQVLEARFSEWWLLWEVSIWLVTPGLFGVFLLGLAAGRSAAFDDPSLWRARARSFARVAFPVGLVLSLFGTLAWRTPGAVVGWGDVFAWPAFSLGALLLSFCYLVLLDKLASSLAMARQARALSCAGRMSLTNYILHSVVANVLFLGFGFGLFGRMSAYDGVLVVALIFSSQMLFSRWWLARHPYGPLERLWRGLSYGGAGRSPRHTVGERPS